MKLIWKLFAQIFLLLCFTVCFCEYLVYYLVIRQCSWPDIQNDQDSSMIKTMFLADTHLLGPFRGHWFDKLRREWQMYRSFQSAVEIYQPEVVFILGDLFDEGQWCDNKKFQDYINRFFSLFQVPMGTKLHVVPGNHDVGFHYAIRLSLLDNFDDTFNTSSVQFLNLKGNYFILLNSMAMEGDGCYLCNEAEGKIKKISRELTCMRDEKCVKKKKLKYSRPIILQHFPMYRKSDALCTEIDEAPFYLKNTNFKERWDCLSKTSSEMIYNELNPRAIFTGHVHHGCHTVHKGDIHEYTLPSFSWRNKNNPTFILAKITPHTYSTMKCELPRETTVIFTYIFSCLASIIWAMHKLKHSNSKTKLTNVYSGVKRVFLVVCEYKKKFTKNQYFVI